MNSIRSSSVVSACLVLAVVFACFVSASADMLDEEKGRKISSSPGLDCEKSKFSWDCLKLDLVTLLESMSETKEYKIGGGLSIVQDASSSLNRTKNAEIVAGKSREVVKMFIQL